MLRRYFCDSELLGYSDCDSFAIGLSRPSAWLLVLGVENRFPFVLAALRLFPLCQLLTCSDTTDCRSTCLIRRRLPQF